MQLEFQGALELWVNLYDLSYFVSPNQLHKFPVFPRLQPAWVSYRGRCWRSLNESSCHWRQVEITGGRDVDAFAEVEVAGQKDPCWDEMSKCGCGGQGDKDTTNMPIIWDTRLLNEVFVREVFKFKLACDVLVDQLIDLSQDSQVPTRAKVLSCKGGWTLTEWVSGFSEMKAHLLENVLPSDDGEFWHHSMPR